MDFDDFFLEALLRALDAYFAFFMLMTVFALIAYVLFMLIVIRAAKDKGYPHMGFQLCFIGLFLFPFTPALVVAALPDKSAHRNGNFRRIDDELPSI